MVVSIKPIAPTQYRIAPATFEDAAAILELQKRAYESEARLYGDWTLPPLTQTLPSLREEFASSTVLKAMEGDRLVGSVRAREAEGLCLIGRLIVEPQLQGRGVGTMLMHHIESRFPQVRGFELFTGSRSEGNLRLYEHLGYRRSREKELSATVTLVFLEKLR
jgi:GNAT superfamily N-acetyltransferase